MEWVEVQAKTVEAAVEVAVAELGLGSADEAAVEVIQEPGKGFLGFGGEDAIVRVKPAPKDRGGKRRRGGRGGEGRGGRGSEGRGGSNRSGGRRQGGGGQGGGGQGGGGQGGGGQGGQGGRSQGRKDGGNRNQGRGKNQGGTGGKPSNDKGKRGERQPRQDASRGPKRNNKGPQDTAGSRRSSEPSTKSLEEADIKEQADILQEFMEGIVSAFGLEGKTTTRTEEDIIYVDVSGEQTEALIGAKGAILQSILDLMKIVVQRKTHHRARIRLDIAGYSERRRQALGIYSQRLSEQVLSDGEEVMLEAMHPGDRKVVHDAVAEIEGVHSWSEGEEPHRSVVIGLAPGFTATGGADDDSE